MAPGPINDQVKQVLKLVDNKNNLYFQRWRKVQLAGEKPEALAEIDKYIADAEKAIDEARQPKLHHFELRPAVETPTAVR